MKLSECTIGKVVKPKNMDNDLALEKKMVGHITSLLYNGEERPLVVVGCYEEEWLRSPEDLEPYEG
jgi:hypothetical protein